MVPAAVAVWALSSEQSTGGACGHWSPRARGGLSAQVVDFSAAMKIQLLAQSFGDAGLPPGPERPFPPAWSDSKNISAVELLFL